MNCYVPGHVLIFPETDGWEKHAGRIREIMPFPFEIIYSVEDMLEHYGLRDSISDLKHKFGSLPFVGRVPEGLEADASHQIRRIPDIKVALPDFLVAPTAVQLELNNAVIDSAINALSADPACPDCGTGVKIAVLDTGIDLAYLTLSSTSHILQFDAEQPQKAGQSPSDSFGHGTLVAHIKKNSTFIRNHFS